MLSLFNEHMPGDNMNTIQRGFDSTVLTSEAMSNMSLFNFDVCYRSGVPRRFVVVSDSALLLKTVGKKSKGKR